MDVLFEEWNLYLEYSNKLRVSYEDIGPWSQFPQSVKVQKDQPLLKPRYNIIIRRRPKSKKYPSSIPAKQGTYILNDLGNDASTGETSPMENNFIYRLKSCSLPVKNYFFKPPLKYALRLKNFVRKPYNKVRLYRLFSRNHMVGNRIQQRKKLRLSHEGIRYPRLPVSNITEGQALEIRALRPQTDMFNCTVKSVVQVRLKEE